MASVAGGPVPFSQLFVPGGAEQTTPFVGGLQQVMPFLPVGGLMQSNSYVFGASMSPRGFAVQMSPAFGDARGGLVAGSDLVVTEIEPGSACAGRVQEPPEAVEEINVDVPPERREDGVRTPRKRQAEQEVFIGTLERGPEPRSSRVRQVQSAGYAFDAFDACRDAWKFFSASWKSFDQCSVDLDTGWYYVWRDT